MSKLTKEINKINLAVIGISGRLVFYALVLVLLVLGVRKTYEFGHDISMPREWKHSRGRKRL